MIPSIDHVQIAIPQGGEFQARWYYGALLGMNEIEKPANLQARGGVWFQTANLQLHLGVDPAFLPATKAHVAFTFTDLNQVRERLMEAGIIIIDDEPLPGFERFYVADPFGNRIECLTPAESGNQPVRT